MKDGTSKVAIITGGSYGIGKACSIALAKSGINVVIFSRKRKEGLNAIRELEKFSIKTLHIETDVSEKTQVAKSVESVYKEFNQIDIVVNNAGIVTPLRYFFKQTDGDWDKVIRVHLYGTYYVMKAVPPIMIRQKFGRIVNISSTAAHLGSCGRANYAAAKCAVEGLTLTAAKELGKNGITVNVIRPGYTVTPLTMARGYNFDLIAKMIPVQRIGAPEDVARIVNFLVQKEADFITGQIISVDGGLSLSGEGLSKELYPLGPLNS